MPNRAAQLRALHPGKSVSKRTRNSIHFHNDGASHTAVLTMEPLHYGAELNEIDTTWIADTGVWQWKMTANAFHLHAKSALNAGQIVEWIDTRSGESVTLQPMGLYWVNSVNNALQLISMPQSVSAVADDDQLFWQNGYGPGRHFRYSAHPKKLIKEIIVDAPENLPAPTVSSPHLLVEFILSKSAGLTIYTDGVEWNNSTTKATSGNIEFRLADGTVAWTFDRPMVTDANGEVTYGIFQVSRRGNSRYCTVRVPKTWLDAATFPIVIDPTFTDGNGGDVETAFDGNTRGGSPTSEFSTSTSLRTRPNSGSVSLGLLMFDLSSLSGDTVDDATIYITKTFSSAGTDGLIYFNVILAANSGWLETCTYEYADGATNTDRWAGDTGNDGGSDAGCQVVGTDIHLTAAGSFTQINADANGTEYSASLNASHIQDWVDGNNYGIAVRGSNNSWDFASSDHATTTYRPKLVVTYTVAGPTTLTADDGSFTESGQSVTFQTSMAASHGSYS